MKHLTITRLLAFLCVFALLLPLVPESVAYGDASSWFTQELDTMEELGLIPQELGDKASLKGNITRLEMAVTALQAFEVYTGKEAAAPADPKPFQDSNSEVLAKAYDLGLVNGYPEGTFCPNNLLTRQEFFTIVYNFLLVCGWEPGEDSYADLSGFRDAASVGRWALEATQVTVGLGIVRGDGTVLMPGNTTTCEQALAMFLRGYLVLTELEPEPTEPEPTEPEPTEPEPTEPTEPEPTEPEPTEPEPTEPEPTEPEPTEPEPTEPDPFNTRYPGMDAWAYSELQPMDASGLIPSILVGKDMKEPITRREVCYISVTAFLGIYPDYPLDSYDNPFTDVNDKTVTIAYNLGLVNGFPDNTFQPDAPITREQFFTIAGNFLEQVGYFQTDDSDVDLSKFKDAGSIQPYALPATRLLYGMGIIKGADGYLSPRDNTQRQQGLAMFYRTYMAFLQWCGGSVSMDEREALVNFTLGYLDFPYVWAGETPEEGFDCSGLVYYVFRQFGYNVPRTAKDQWNYSKAIPVEPDMMLPGDLVFFSDTSSWRGIYHVGIYIGDGLFVHAANPERGVVMDTVESGYYKTYFFGAKRIVP